jgi:hypothetical protein
MTTLRTLEQLLAKYENAANHVRALIKLERENQLPDAPQLQEPSSAALIAYLDSRNHQVSCRKVAGHFGVPIEMIRDLMKSYSTGYQVGKNGMIFKRSNR